MNVLATATIAPLAQRQAARQADPRPRRPTAPPGQLGAAIARRRSSPSRMLGTRLRPAGRHPRRDSSWRAAGAAQGAVSPAPHEGGKQQHEDVHGASLWRCSPLLALALRPRRLRRRRRRQRQQRQRLRAARPATQSSRRTRPTAKTASPSARRTSPSSSSSARSTPRRSRPPASRSRRSSTSAPSRSPTRRSSRGEVDVYPEYTGTALTSFFKVKTDDVPKDPHQAFEQAKAEYGQGRASPRCRARRSRTRTGSPSTKATARRSSATRRRCRSSAATPAS